MTDETILAGFANLHEALTTGFDTLRREMAELKTELRSDMAAMEHRILRRFDTVDERVDDHERRITALESREST